ncbi:MAG TPA: type II secretion system protein GspC [Candidatus Binataceae bacterium]|nr:type II secretion system protein GspC [Candidatus Binataceae bacterium]
MELRLTERHIIAVNLLLIAGITYFAARAVNGVIARDLTMAPAAHRLGLGTLTPSRPRTREQYDSIARRDIFNLMPVAAPAARPVTEEDLHLHLIGISQLTLGSPFAIIEDQNGEQAVWRQGDEIPDAGKLSSVEATRVLIEHDNKLVALELPVERPEEEPAASVAGRFSMGIPLTRMSETDSSSELDQDIDVEETAPGRYAVKRSDIKMALRHTADLMTQIHATPNMENGHPNGLTISEIEPGSVFEDLGLQDGDILTSIDGRPLTNPSTAISMLSSLPSRPSVEVTVMRDGTPTQLHYDIH